MYVFDMHTKKSKTEKKENMCKFSKVFDCSKVFGSAAFSFGEGHISLVLLSLR